MVRPDTVQEYPPSHPFSDIINPASYAVNTLSLMSYLVPRSTFNSDDIQDAFFIVWPPNLFALTSMLFTITGSYSRLTIKDDWPPTEFAAWQQKINESAIEWEKRLGEISDFSFLRISDLEEWVKHRDSVPALVKSTWEELKNALEADGTGDAQDMWNSDEKHKNLFHAAMTLHAIADLTCRGWGIRKLPRQPEAAVAAATSLLSQFGTLAVVHPDRCRILPKRHTTQVGITLRSVSSNIAFHRSSTRVKWETDGPPLLGEPASSISTLSVLLLPWPLTIRAKDFVGRVVGTEDEKEREFSYSPTEDSARPVRMLLKSVLEEAEREVGKIDLAILPELSLDENELDDLENSLARSVKAYIAGVRRKQENKSTWRAISGRELEQRGNAVCYGFRREEDRNWYRDFQDKHHRWRLSSWQIKSYQLGGTLHPHYNWWESISIGRRRVSFINLGQELTICPLICEDLARQDPIADLIRAVGPSLVVAILMDGPQLRSRWAARYASVLADDPGSSVITLTAAGMVDRYAVPGTEPMRSIALWSDRAGSTKEIVLEKGAQAVVLSLAVEQVSEGTIDRRRETVGTYTLTFGGVHQIKVSDDSKS